MMMQKLFDVEKPLGALEAAYRRQYLEQDIRQVLIVFSIWLLPHFVFIYTDYLLYARQPLFHDLLEIRLALLIVLLIMFIVLRRIKKPIIYDYLVFFGCSIVLAGIFWANRLHPNIHTYTAGMDYLLLFSTYLLIPNRLLFRILPCIVFTTANLILRLTLLDPLSAPIPTIIIIPFIMTNGLGIWASINFYSHRRQQFAAQTHAFELRKDLIQNALVDQLTGVANRRHFFQTAEAEFERYLRYKRPFSVLMLDLDHFKNINDLFGHPVGDKVLKDLAITVNRYKRDTDLFGRLGGEEFALLMPETNLSAATDIAVRLRRACHTIILPNSSSLRITISIGVTQIHPDDASFDEVLARTDEVLYRAKNNGRDRVEVG